MWMDLRLSGIEPESIDPIQKSLLIGHMARKRDTRFLEVTLIIRAILTAAHIIAKSSTDNKLSDALKEYTTHLFPETKYETEDMAKRAATILEKELAKGPLKIQAQDYGKRRRRNKR